MSAEPKPRVPGRVPAIAVGALLALATAGCGRETWLTAPAGELAGRISGIAWIFGAVGATVWVVTLAFLTLAVVRGRRRAAPATDEGTTRGLARGIVTAAVVTLVLLLSLAVLDFATLRALHGPEAGDDPLTIQVTGHQWWWEVTYEPEQPTRRFETANEIHVPVGEPVLLRLQARDVIHSFWVPRLQGKRDLIPGYETTLWIEADEPGVFEGVCAEFCGLQHANMRLLVIALPPDSFRTWYATQHAPAVPPTGALALRGREVFEGRRCALCHAIRGTAARGQVAPDLTHLASRRTLAAGTIPNTRGRLAGWIADPHGVKPGVKMPPNPIEGEALQALLEYLEGLR